MDELNIFSCKLDLLIGFHFLLILVTFIKLTLCGMSSVHFYRKNQFKVFSLGCTFRTRKVPTQILGNVSCPILRIKTSIPQCWCGLATDWIGL